jgi:hypothetical protein
MNIKIYNIAFIKSLPPKQYRLPLTFLRALGKSQILELVFSDKTPEVSESITIVPVF